MLPLAFCVIAPVDYPMMLNRPAIELALSEVVAAHGRAPNVLYIESGYTAFSWRTRPWQLMKQLEPLMSKPYTCLVAGMGGFAGTWDDGFSLLGDYALWSIQWGQLPYCGLCLEDSHRIYFSRYAQQGAIWHEINHRLHPGVDTHKLETVPWWDRFPIPKGGV